MNRKIVVLVLGMVFALGSCGGAADRKAAYMQKGQALYDQGNYEKARVEFKNVLQIDPKDVPSRMALAKTLEKLQDWRGAAGHYLAVIETDPSNKEALSRMGQIYLLSRNYEEAAKNADKIIALDATDPEGLTLRAGVKALKGDLDSALEDALKALERSPGHANASALAASIYLQKQMPDESVSTLRKALEHDPKNATLTSILARIEAQLGHNDEAIKLFTDIINQEPAILPHRLRLANFYLSQKRLDDAEAVLKKAMTDLKDDVNAKLAYVEFLARQRSGEQAATALEALVKAEPDKFELRAALGKLYEAANQFDKAKEVYQAIIAKEEKDSPNALNAKTRLAVVSLRAGNRDEAKKIVGEVLTVNPRDKDALLLRGTLSLDAGDPTSAISDYRAALKDDPDSADLLRLLAKAHLANKEPQLAKDTLKKAAGANPADIGVHGDLANIYSMEKDLDGAVGELNEALKIDPKNHAALEGIFKIRVFQKDWEKANEIASRIKEAYPNEPTGFYFAGLVDQAEKKFPESIEQFESALAVSPDAIQPLSQLVKSYLALRQQDTAEKRLQEVIERNPKNFVALNLLGELRLAAKKYAEAQKLFESALGLNKEWAILYRNLASSKIAQNDEAGAIKTMEEGIDTTKGSALLVTGLASYLEKTGKLDQAIAQYEKLLKESPDAPLVANNLAMLLIEYKDDDASRNRAKELADKLKTSQEPAFLDTVGWVAYKFGDYDRAIELLEKAIAAAPDAAIMHYHLGIAYLKRGNSVLAKDHLKQAVDANVEYRGLDEAKSELAKLDAG